MTSWIKYVVMLYSFLCLIFLRQQLMWPQIIAMIKPFACKCWSCQFWSHVCYFCHLFVPLYPMHILLGITNELRGSILLCTFNRKYPDLPNRLIHRGVFFFFFGGGRCLGHLFTLYPLKSPNFTSNTGLNQKKNCFKCVIMAVIFLQQLVYCNIHQGY